MGKGGSYLGRLPKHAMGMAKNIKIRAKKLARGVIFALRGLMTVHQEGPAHREASGPDAGSSLQPEDLEKQNSSSQPSEDSITSRTAPSLRGGFSHIVRSVISLQQSLRAISLAWPTLRRQRHSLPDSSQHTRSETIPLRKGSSMDTLNASRVTLLIPKLKHLTPTHDFSAHGAPVRCVQFSPDGNFLATTGFDFFFALSIKHY